jgi:hypothetical protein
MNLQDLILLDRQLELYAQNGRFLGLLSSDLTIVDPDIMIGIYIDLSNKQNLLNLLDLVNI